METDKLDKWAQLLLDTGKRNNLINFKDSKSSTVEILSPSPFELFSQIDGDKTFEVYDPKLIQLDDDLNIEDDEDDEPKEEYLSEKEAYYNNYISKAKNQLLVYNESKYPLEALKKIKKKSQEYVQETGTNVCYIAFGFILWKEIDYSECTYKAPILLVPIEIQQESSISPFKIKVTGDDIVINPTFEYKLNVEHNITLPNYNDEGLEEYLNKINEIVSKLNWSITSESKIGLFSFSKINMYQDIKENKEKILQNKNVRILLGEESSLGFNDGEFKSDIKNPLVELHNVVDADSSQIEAIEMAKSGKSFVLQGPPGTGKSQTITNIIAECLSDNKKVLFVSEKLAALNVVYDKLKKAGLEEFTLQLHSHKANKKDLVKELAHTLRLEKKEVSSKAYDEIHIKEKTQEQLDQYATKLHLNQPIINKSLYQLFERYSALKDKKDIDYVINDISNKDEAYLNEAMSLLDQYIKFIPSIGYNYTNNTWYGYINQDSSYQQKIDLKNNISNTITLFNLLTPIQNEISSKYNVKCNNVYDVEILNNLFNLLSTSKLIKPSLLNKEIFNEVNCSLRNLNKLNNEINLLITTLNKSFDNDIFKIDGNKNHKLLTKTYTSSIKRVFNSDYKKIISELKLCSKDNKKISYEEAIKIFENLSTYQNKNKEFKEIEDKIIKYLGSSYNGIKTDWNLVIKDLDSLNEILNHDYSFIEFEKYQTFDFEIDNFKKYHQEIDDTFNVINKEVLNKVSSYFDNNIIDIYKDETDTLLDKFLRCINELDNIETYNQFRSILNKMENIDILSYTDYSISINMQVDDIVSSFEKQFYFQWIDYILNNDPTLSTFSRISQDQANEIFKDKDKEQFEINKAIIRSSLSNNRPSLDVITPGSGASIILREAEKKSKLKSIRLLLAEAGEVIQTIKPCFLMSPLSVSTFLNNDTIHFDVVIFDEASQIFPQDAIGAIYRANQLIVVGDSKQMPPSNFFNSTLDALDEGDENEDITDFESILDLCSTTFTQLRLKWHYRSKYEQLISFSNKNFYDNELITFPSSKVDCKGIGVDYYYVDSIFDRKSHTNRQEAEFIVDLIYENIEKYPDRSLGVVAFSISQQDLIDRLLSKRRQATPEKEFFFSSDKEEPFFIKNLETVQGDERDTIIFSIAYGFDSNRYLLHNFGPLNKVGGERRLNVAITRAKSNVQVVSCMHYLDIDLKRTSSVGARLLREYLDYAENGNIALSRSLSVSNYDQFDSDFEMEVCQFLRDNGYFVDTQVGCSGFRIDLGLKKDNNSDYVLAIECDGASYHSYKNARDRDRLRQEILERMGWKFYRIWSTDWFKNKTEEKNRLLVAVNNAVNNIEDVKKNNDQPIIDFEETKVDIHFSFPKYKLADIPKLWQEKNELGQSFCYFVKQVLEVEAPLSDDLFLKRTCYLFSIQAKVTPSVKNMFDRIMLDGDKYGIKRQNGFLYLKNKEIQFRESGDIHRDIKQISIEELSDGLYQLIKVNIKVEKMGLFQTFIKYCGLSHLGSYSLNALEKALALINDKVNIEGDIISLK